MGFRQHLNLRRPPKIPSIFSSREYDAFDMFSRLTSLLLPAILLRLLLLIVCFAIIAALASTVAAQMLPADDQGLDQLIRLQDKVRQVIQEVSPAVVAIDDTGSGVVVSADGIVLTASHVSLKANRIVNVLFSDGRIVQGITLGSNFATDTGAIRLLSPGPFPFLKVSESVTADTGTWCIAMGYPLSFPRGQAASGRLGRILERQGNQKIVTDCTIMGGDSGGPLLNLDGKVIAINSSVKLDIDKNLYIPSERFVENWKHISLSIDRSGSNAIAAKEALNVARQTAPNVKPADRQPSAFGYLGVSTESDDGFVRIRRVHRGSPAEKSGLAAEDVITAINSKKITNFQELVSQLKQHLPASVVTVRLLRFGQILEIPVTLGSSRIK